MILKLDGNEVADAYGWLANAYANSLNEPADRFLDPDERVTLDTTLDQTERLCQTLDLASLRAHLDRVRVDLTNAATYGDVQGLLSELRQRMQDELKERVLLLVSSSDSIYYAKSEAFDKEVTTAFPESTDDIEKAGTCIAFGLYTASAFHLMRVLERGLYALASRVAGLARKQASAASHDKDWQTALNEINDNISSIGNAEVRDDCAAVAVHLSSVKLASKDPVANLKVSYTAEQAMELYDHTKVFMRHLARITSATATEKGNRADARGADPRRPQDGPSSTGLPPVETSVPTNRLTEAPRSILV
jgi:hypothetical protein